MTFLQLINDVLIRLRESQVTSVSANDYTTLIGKLVNDAKKVVEDSWNWEALATTITVTTTGGNSTVTVTGSGLRIKDEVINDTTNRSKLTKVPIQWIMDQQQLTTVSTGVPVYYAWNGHNGTDRKIELFPTPNGTFTLKVNAYVPQADLSSASDVLSVPSQPVALGAYARALVERGEDGGLPSSEAFALYKTALSDEIALESARFIENETFTPT